MSTTLTITLDTIESQRVRAQIAGDGVGNFGVFAEADDAPTAAGQAVKAFLAMQSPPQVKIENSAPRPWRFGHTEISRQLQAAANAGDKLRIEYRDAGDHITTRVIEPSSVSHGRVFAYDHLREAVRSFKVANVQAVQPL